MAVVDASSLLSLVLEEGGDGVELVFDQTVLDLTVYEAGNAIWRSTVLQDRISRDEADDLVGLLDDLLEQVTVADVGSLPLDRVLDVAAATELTFYDAAYVVVAEETGQELWTEDGELAGAAEQFVAVGSVDGT